MLTASKRASLVCILPCAQLRSRTASYADISKESGSRTQFGLGIMMIAAVDCISNVGAAKGHACHGGENLRNEQLVPSSESRQLLPILKARLPSFRSGKPRSGPSDMTLR